MLWLLAAEGALVTVAGVGAGVAAAAAVIVAMGPWLQARWGLAVASTPPTPAQWGLLAAIAVAGITASLVPGWQAYRMSLADGLSPRD